MCIRDRGVADCVFAEDGGAVIVDYKTDHVRTPAELVERYRVQLELYRKVLGLSLIHIFGQMMEPISFPEKPLLS